MPSPPERPAASGEASPRTSGHWRTRSPPPPEPAWSASELLPLPDPWVRPRIKDDRGDNAVSGIAEAHPELVGHDHMTGPPTDRHHGVRSSSTGRLLIGPPEVARFEISGPVVGSGVSTPGWSSVLVITDVGGIGESQAHGDSPFGECLKASENRGVGAGGDAQTWKF